MAFRVRAARPQRGEAYEITFRKGYCPEKGVISRLLAPTLEGARAYYQYSTYNT